MKTKTYIILTVLVMAAFFMSACGKEEETEVVPEAPETPAETVQEEPEEVADEVEEEPEETEAEEEEEEPEEIEVTPPPVATVDCGSDLECFTEKAADCVSAKLLHVYSLEETPGIVTTMSTPYEITGEVDGECNFFHGTALFEVKATKEGIETVMGQESKTEEEVAEELEELNKLFKSAADTGGKVIFKTNDGKNIIDHIQKLFSGQEKIVNIDGEIKYGDNITCEEE